MFGNASKPSRNYSYFARGPVAGVEHVSSQMRLAHRYKNKLVELERQRRTAVEQAMTEMFPAVSGIDGRIQVIVTELDSLRTLAKGENAKARKHVVTDGTKQRIKSIKSDLSLLRGERKAIRKEAFGSQVWKDRQEAIDANDLALRKQARAESMLYWGNYLPVEQAMGACRKGAPPQFEPYRGDGTIAVQLQGGLSVSEAFTGKDSKLRIDPLPDGAYLTKSRVNRRTTVHVRVGSDGSKPIWASFPVVLHRPLPADAQIKWVYVHRCRKGYSDEWSIRFVLAKEAGWSKEGRAVAGTVAIDLGWRIVPAGLRVAYWVDDAGQEGELVLPNRRGVNDWDYLLRKAEDLQSIRDGHFNPARDGLAEWISAQSNLPEWFTAMADHVSQWRSKPRLVRLIQNWGQNRFEGDAEVFGNMEAWLKKELHLESWESANRDRFSRQRKEIYRVFAATMSQRYKTLICEKLDLKVMQDLPPVEEAVSDDGVRKNQKNAFVSLLVQCLRESFESDMLEVEAANTTRRCCSCGHIADTGSAALLVTCVSCKTTHDQDKNAANNLLSGGLDSRGAAA